MHEAEDQSQRRKMFVQWVLSDENVKANKLKPDIRQAMYDVDAQCMERCNEADNSKLLFLEENGSSSQAASREICAELSRMTVTARHVHIGGRAIQRASGSL